MEFNSTIFLLQLITFALGLALAYFIYMPYLRGWMNERQKRIAGQLDQAAKSQKDAEALKADLEKKMREMDQKVQTTLAEARGEADKTKSEIVSVARKEAEKILVDTRAALQQEKQDAVKAIQKEMGSLAVAIAEKIIRGQIDPKTQQKLIDESLKELTAKKN